MKQQPTHTVIFFVPEQEKQQSEPQPQQQGHVPQPQEQECTSADEFAAEGRRKGLAQITCYLGSQREDKARKLYVRTVTALNWFKAYGEDLFVYDRTKLPAEVQENVSKSAAHHRYAVGHGRTGTLVATGHTIYDAKTRAASEVLASPEAAASCEARLKQKGIAVPLNGF